jgi:hypothetical protein
MGTLEGTQSIRAEKVTLSRLAVNIQEISLHGIKFCCEHAVKIVEVIGKYLALINEGTTSQTMK